MRTLILIVSLALHATAQVSASRIATMRYNDRTGAHMSGDTFRCSQKVGAYYYCTWNDGLGPTDPGLPGLANRNMGIFRLSLDLADANNTVLTLLDSTALYGGLAQDNTNGWTDNANWKSGGLDFHGGGKLYWQVQLQCWSPLTGDCVGSGMVAGGSGVNSTILMSTDATTANPNHWCNPKTVAANSGTCPVNATTAGGDPPQGPAADSAVMWPGPGHMMDMQPIQYAAGDTTDGSATTCYWMSRGSLLTGYYISGSPCSSIQDVTTWWYYTGPPGGDVNNPSNRCSTSYTACAATHTMIVPGDYPSFSAGIGWTASMEHLPAPWNVYVAVGAVISGGGFSQRLFWAPSMTGPFTAITADAPLGAGGMQNFPQLLLDTLVVSDASNKIGTIAAISGGGAGAGVDYSPFFGTYQLGPGTFTRGPRYQGNGMQTQGNSSIRLSQGMVANAIPAKGLKQLWMFDDHAKLPTTWPVIEATEFFGGTKCAKFGGVTLTAAGMSFDGTGGGAASASRCVTTGNAPAFLSGNSSYSILAVFRTNTAVGGSVFSAGTPSSSNGLFLYTSVDASGDLGWSSYVPYVYSAPALFTAGNAYFVGVTRSGGGGVTAVNTQIYLGGQKIRLIYVDGTPNVLAAPVTFGANRMATAGFYSSVLNGTLIAEAIYDRALSAPEVSRAYQALKRIAARRGVTIQ